MLKHIHTHTSTLASTNPTYTQVGSSVCLSVPTVDCLVFPSGLPSCVLNQTNMDISFSSFSVSSQRHTKTETPVLIRDLFFLPFDMRVCVCVCVCVCVSNKTHRKLKNVSLCLTEFCVCVAECFFVFNCVLSMPVTAILLSWHVYFLYIFCRSSRH